MTRWLCALFIVLFCAATVAAAGPSVLIRTAPLRHDGPPVNGEKELSMISRIAIVNRGEPAMRCLAAVSELAALFFASARVRTIGEALAEAVRGANTAVLRAAESTGNANAASTLVAAAVRGTDAVVANLGDSRAYLVRAGAARQISEDHSGELANSITRFVGDPRGVQPDVFAERLGPRDRLVLCSDGLTRHVSDEEIARTVTARAPQAAADELVRLALERGGEDNVTVIVSVPAGARRASLGLFFFGVFVAFVLIVIAAVAALIVSTPSLTR